VGIDLKILYRGPLSSCNYDCGYCPFAKHHETAAELVTDRQSLERFVEWVLTRQSDRLSVFFTPWGEALTRPWYHEAFSNLSHCGHVAKVAVQTNLSFPLDWLSKCDVRRLGFWCTFHPSQTDRNIFLQQCEKLHERGVSFSVGMVGLKEDIDEARSLRAELPSDVYMWINAYKDEPDYYEESDTKAFASIDPHFHHNLVNYPSLGKSCDAGSRVISVDGNGNVSRCHFVKEKLGNLYETEIGEMLFPRRCTKQTCECHIGYVHMPELQLHSIYGEGILERVPSASSQE
jgi:sulfatase maturation enzyme AslB (radical SAM superfamily)